MSFSSENYILKSYYVFFLHFNHLPCFFNTDSDFCIFREGEFERERAKKRERKKPESREVKGELDLVRVLKSC